MSPLSRFGVSISKDILSKFDAVIRRQNYPTRSKAIEDTIRTAISEESFASDSTVVVGTVNVIYDHRKRELLNKLTDIQHDYQDIILTSQHIHMDHNNCFEIVVLKGSKARIEELANNIKSTKGVMHSTLSIVAPVHAHVHG